MLRYSLILLFLFLPGVASSAPFKCPAGAELREEKTEEVTEAWCEILVDGVSLQHGPYRAWHPDGKVAAEGQYEKGKPVGKWTNWYDNGVKQSEENYSNGNKTTSKYWDYKGKPIDAVTHQDGH